MGIELDRKTDSTISVRVPWAMFLDMDLLVAQGMWTNRAQFVRAAIMALLTTSRSSVAPFRELDELLKTFDDQYVEIWRDLNAARELVAKVDRLKDKLRDYPDLMVKIAQVERRSKLLSVARTDIGQIPPVGSGYLHKEEKSKEADPFFAALEQVRRTGIDEGRDVSWLDKMEMVGENNLGEDQSQEAETLQI